MTEKENPQSLRAAVSRVRDDIAGWRYTYSNKQKKGLNRWVRQLTAALDVAPDGSVAEATKYPLPEVKYDPSIPEDEIHLRYGNLTVCKIINVATKTAPPPGPGYIAAADVRELVDEVTRRSEQMVTRDWVNRELLALIDAAGSPTDYIDIVFDGPPEHVAGRFVEVENSDGASISFGKWVERADGYWALRIAVAGEPDATAKPSWYCEACGRVAPETDRRKVCSICVKAFLKSAAGEQEPQVPTDAQMKAIIDKFCNWYWHPKDYGRPANLFSRMYPDDESDSWFKRFLEDCPQPYRKPTAEQPPDYEGDIMEILRESEGRIVRGLTNIDFATIITAKPGERIMIRVDDIEKVNGALDGVLQIELPDLPKFDDIEPKKDIKAKPLPLGITIGTGVQFGRPCIAGTGVPAEAVFERFMAGESIPALAKDYNLSWKQIEPAIRYGREPDLEGCDEPDS